MQSDFSFLAFPNKLLFRTKRFVWLVSFFFVEKFDKKMVKKY